MLLVGCSVFETKISYSLEGAREICAVTEFDWQYPDGQVDYGSLVFREETGDSSTAVLVSREDRLLMSNNKYRWDLSSGKIESISEERWKAGQPIEIERPDFAPSESLRAGQPANYAGKSFQPSGHYWPGAFDGRVIPSPDGEFLILQTQEEERGRGGPIYGEDPSSGHVYIEVFAVKSGKKLATIRGVLHNTSASVFFGTTSWLKKRFVLGSLATGFRRLVVCDPGRGQ